MLSIMLSHPKYHPGTQRSPHALSHPGEKNCSQAVVVASCSPRCGDPQPPGFLHLSIFIAPIHGQPAPVHPCHPAQTPRRQGLAGEMGMETPNPVGGEKRRMLQGGTCGIIPFLSPHRRLCALPLPPARLTTGPFRNQPGGREYYMWSVFCSMLFHSQIRQVTATDPYARRQLGQG